MRKDARERAKFVCEAREISFECARIGTGRDRGEAELDEAAHLPREQPLVICDPKREAFALGVSGAVDVKPHQFAHGLAVEVACLCRIRARGRE